MGVKCADLMPEVQKILESVDLFKRAYFEQFNKKAVNGLSVFALANMQDAYHSRRIAEHKFLPDVIRRSEGKYSRENDLYFAF